MNTSAIYSGFAGAVTLTALHQVLKNNNPDAPRIDLLGIDALAKICNVPFKEWRNNDNIYNLVLAGDLIGNSVYYSLVAAGKKKHALRNGALLGLAAGMGAVVLPGTMGLKEEFSNRTTKTKILTMGIYLAGGIIAGLMYSKACRKQ